MKTFRHVIEAIITAVLFLYRRVPLSGGAFTMLVPLIKLMLYLPTLIIHPELLRYEVFYWRLSTMVGILGLMIAVVGFAIFMKACINFLKRRRKLVTTGLYSVVRHPQYFGITLMTLGTGITLCGYLGDLLFVVVGYILLALYEERNLLREYGEEYREYKQITPFFFPISFPSKVHEIPFTMILAVIMVLVSFLCG